MLAANALLKRMRLTDRSLVAAMCLGQLGNLLPHVAVPAVMPQHLMPLWQLNGMQAGLMASAFAFGYMLAVPVLTTLTDRIDARLVLLVGSAASAIATIAFGLLADGLWSATVIWGLAGMGFAGAYMPGLKALTDRLPAGDASRSITLYTSSFSFGVGLSFLVAQLAADGLGWRAAFIITGLGPFIMVTACLAMSPVEPLPTQRRLLDFKPVVRNRASMGYILGYGAHCFELYGIRTWIVAFWAFVVAQHGGSALLGPIAVSVIFSLIAMPASILGNEAALSFGRHRALTALMLASATVALAIGWSVDASPLLLLVLLLLYAFTVPSDSGALTSGMAMSATPSHKGATMAIHTTVGFGLSALGAWGAGVALDLAGGPSSTSGWLAVFVLLGVSILLGPLALWWSRGAGDDRT
jgi:predicted MFS family arabinose efflux permease